MRTSHTYFAFAHNYKGIQVSAKFACSQPKVTWIGKLEIKKLAA